MMFPTNQIYKNQNIQTMKYLGLCSHVVNITRSSSTSSSLKYTTKRGGKVV